MSMSWVVEGGSRKPGPGTCNGSQHLRSQNKRSRRGIGCLGLYVLRNGQQRGEGKKRKEPWSRRDLLSALRASAASTFGKALPLTRALTHIGPAS